jgi:hypothetical protein
VCYFWHFFIAQLFSSLANKIYRLVLFLFEKKIELEQKNFADCEAILRAVWKSKQRRRRNQKFIRQKKPRLRIGEKNSGSLMNKKSIKMTVYASL